MLSCLVRYEVTQERQKCAQHSSVVIHLFCDLFFCKPSVSIWKEPVTRCQLRPTVQEARPMA